jgi:TRAP-type transport system periplasmic protein
MEMSKRDFLRTMVFALSAYGALSLCIPAPSWAQAYKWKYYGFTALRNPVTQLMVDFAKEAKELTKGQLDIRVYPQGELPYEPGDAVSITSKGLVEMANTEVSYIAGDIPVSPLASMPLMVDTKEEAYKTGKIFIPYLDKVIQEKYDAKILWWYGWPPRKIMGKGEAPAKLADLAGKRFRFPGPIGAEFLVRLGMVPVNINPGDVPTAIERGTLDGTAGAYVYLAATKWYQQCNWAYEIDSGGVFNLTLINKDVYDKLPADMRTALDKLGAKYTNKGTDLGYFLEGKSKASFEKFGIKIVRPSPGEIEEARAKIIPFWNEWAKSKGPGAVAVLQQIRQAIKK